MFLRGSGGAKSRQEKAFRDWVKLRPDETRQNCRLVPVRRKAAAFYPRWLFAEGARLASSTALKIAFRFMFLGGFFRHAGMVRADNFAPVEAGLLLHGGAFLAFGLQKLVNQFVVRRLCHGAILDNRGLDQGPPHRAYAGRPAHPPAPATGKAQSG
jgi:hypothetical protein